MDDLSLNLVVLAATAAVILAIFLIVRRRQAAQAAALERMARERDWIYDTLREPLAWGTRISAPGWTVEALSRSSGRETGPGSSDVTQHTTWTSSAGGSTLLVGQRLGYVNVGVMGRALLDAALRKTFGIEAGDLVEVEAGSEDFRRRYLVMAQNPAEAERLLSPAVENALMAWKGTPPLVHRTPQGTSITLRGAHLKKPEDILALVRLGEALG